MRLAIVRNLNARPRHAQFGLEFEFYLLRPPVRPARNRGLEDDVDPFVVDVHDHYTVEATVQEVLKYGGLRVEGEVVEDEPEETQARRRTFILVERTFIPHVHTTILTSWWGYLFRPSPKTLNERKKGEPSWNGPGYCGVAGKYHLGGSPPPFSRTGPLAFGILRFGKEIGLLGGGPVRVSSIVERGTIHPNTQVLW
jgi:hypothetical protein